MLLEVDGSDAVLTEAQLTTRAVLGALSHESLRRAFLESTPPDFHGSTRRGARANLKAHPDRRTGVMRGVVRVGQLLKTPASILWPVTKAYSTSVLVAPNSMAR